MDKKNVINNFGYTSIVAPSVYQRYWGQALTASGMAFVGTAALVGFGTWGMDILPPVTGTFGEHTKGAFGWGVNYYLPTLFHETAHHYEELLSHIEEHGETAGLFTRLGLMGLSSSFIGWIALKDGLIPRNNLRHIAGRIRLDGDEAVQVAARICRSHAKATEPTSMDKFSKAVGFFTKGILKKEIKKGWRAAKAYYNDPPNPLMDFNIHPSIRLSRELSRFIFLLGGPGSGKTVVIKQVLTQIIRNRERAILHDNKGEFTGFFKDAMLFAPHDARSCVWDIAQDIRSSDEAFEFMCMFIQENDKDPMWSNASRAVATGLMTYLINTQFNPKTKQPTWGWKELAEVLADYSDEDGIKKKIEEHYPNAMGMVASAGTTLQNILINMTSFLRPIFVLNDAWGTKYDYERDEDGDIITVHAGTKIVKDESGIEKTVDIYTNKIKTGDDGRYQETPESYAMNKRKVSLRKWLYEGDRPGYKGAKQIILQGNGKYEQLTQGYIKSILNFLTKEINSPSFGESRKRKLYFILDEFPQLGKGMNIMPLIEVGRSKGIRILIAGQDQNQFKKNFSPEEAASFTAQASLTIFGKSSIGDSAKWIKDMFGQARYERLNVTNAGGANPSNSFTFATEMIDVVTEDELVSNMAEVIPRHSRMLTSMSDNKNKKGYAMFIDFPWTDLPVLRKGGNYVPAAWTKQTVNDGAWDDSKMDAAWKEFEKNVFEKKQAKLELQNQKMLSNTSTVTQQQERKTLLHKQTQQVDTVNQINRMNNQGKTTYQQQETEASSPMDMMVEKQAEHTIVHGIEQAHGDFVGGVAGLAGMAASVYESMDTNKPQQQQIKR